MSALHDPSELAGQMIGQFRVGQPLAGATSGLLYTGWNYAADGASGERKRVWLRFLDERQAADVETLRRQIDGWRAFRHAAVLPIVGFESEAGQPSLVAVDPGDGEILSRRLAAGRLEIVEAVQLVVTIARALEAAHSAKLVHLGLTDEHVVTPKFGDAKPALFGVGAGGRLARGGLAAWHYLAPEQIVAESGGDARADVYALGVLLYRCTTGEYPIALADGLSADDTVGKLIVGARRDPRQWFEVPHAGLVAVMERAIHRDRDRRFQSAGELARALQECGLPLAEVAPEKSDPKGIVVTPPPAGVPVVRAGVHEPTISRTPAPAASASPMPVLPDQPAATASGRPKTLRIDDAPNEGDLVGVVLNDVRIERPLAQGGMAKIYLGKHVKLGRTWVIKVGDVGSAAVQWFEQEALVTSLLREHGERRVPEVLALGRLPAPDNRPYMIMEFVPGRSLAKVLADAPSKRLPLVRALKIAYRIADTLERAHVNGVIHRDIKPDNIMVEEVHGTEDANVRILDWGIARTSGAAKQVKTVTGMMVGTPGYLSPEGTFGEHTDGRSDVFSVACVLYEMLTGTAPFTGSDWLQRINATRGVHPEPLESVRSDLGSYGKSVSDLTTVGLTKDIRYRPTMSDFRAGLNEIMETMEGRRPANAPSPLATMLSAAPPRLNVPLAEQSTHARTDADSADFRMRAIAPDPTRPAKLGATTQKNRGRRIAVAFAISLVLAGGVAAYVVASRYRTPPVAKTPAAAEAQPSKPTHAEAPRPELVPPTPAAVQPVVQAPPVATSTPKLTEPTKPIDSKRTREHHHGQRKGAGNTINPFEE